MPLSIPPIQWPKIYNMVNLGGIDLATANGSEVPGIYQKITDALTSDHIEVFYNWKFADIVLPPSKVVIDVSVANQYTINEEILIKSDDTVGIIGFIRIPVIVPLTAEENAVYNIPTGTDGFGPVTVQVPLPTPTLVSLNVDENGIYTPATGVDGFSQVEVNVPPVTPVLIPLSVTENGEYTPLTGQDGFSSVNVNLPYPYIVPDYFGLSYGYIANNGYYYSSDSNTAAVGYFHVTAGKYVAFAGEDISNRFRIQFYAGKSFSDFEEYVLNPLENVQIYQATENITGTTELTGKDLKQRMFFTVSSTGEVIFTTSYASVLNPAFLFKIS